MSVPLWARTTGHDMALWEIVKEWWERLEDLIAEEPVDILDCEKEIERLELEKGKLEMELRLERGNVELLRRRYSDAQRHQSQLDRAADLDARIRAHRHTTRQAVRALEDHRRFQREKVELLEYAMGGWFPPSEWYEYLETKGRRRVEIDI